MSGVNSQLNTFPTSPTNVRSTEGYPPAFTVRFWGVRGNIPTSSPNTAFYGGNTPCVELTVNGQRLIFDGGTGLRLLGEKMFSDSPLEAHLFFTHTQLDRIQGFPFFRPAFDANNRIHVYGPASTNGASIKHALAEQMVRPRFHVPLHQMSADLSFQTLSPGTSVNLDGVTVESIMLSSDNSSLGYRVSWNDYTVVYATDSYGSSAQQSLLDLGKHADLLIFDAVQSGSDYYDPQSLNNLKQFSTWTQSLEAAIGLGSKQVILFYLDPSHEDAFLRQLEQEVQAIYPNVHVAQEGKLLTVGHCANP